MIVTVTNNVCTHVPCAAYVSLYPCIRRVQSILKGAGLDYCLKSAVAQTDGLSRRKIAIEIEPNARVQFKNIVFLCNYNRTYPLSDTLEEAIQFANQQKFASVAVNLDEFECIFGQNEQLVAAILKAVITKFEQSFWIRNPTLQSVVVITDFRPQIENVFA